MQFLGFSPEIKPDLKCLITNSGSEDIDNIHKSLYGNLRNNNSPPGAGNPNRLPFIDPIYKSDHDFSIGTTCTSLLFSNINLKKTPGPNKNQLLPCRFMRLPYGC
jgi:hypothetical protein